MEAAEDALSESPCSQYPIFGWLSPHQRIALVAQVAVGLLCPNEPLPPPTLQHVAAYHGVIDFIKSELELEMFDVYNREVGEDLLEEFYEKNRPKHECGFLTEEEMEKRAPSKALIGRAAAKNKKKLDRTDDMQDVKEEFKAVKKKVDPRAAYEMVENIRAAIFSGPPCTEQDRRSPRELTYEERNFGFDWRLKCDAAFQEDVPKVPPTCFIDFALPPLCKADFCWKSYEINKWIDGVNLLMIMKYFNFCIKDNERALLNGPINDVSYADPTQHSRIQAVTKIVKDLRNSYDPYWDPAKLAADERLIFAICAEDYAGHSKAHSDFALTFYDECWGKGIDITKPGNYQERFDVYHSIQHDFNDGLDKSFINGEPTLGQVESPAAFEPIESLAFTGCAWSKCPKNGQVLKKCNVVLKSCARCKVVKYCSKECQQRHWRVHRKDCPNLALWRKDKDKLKEIVKEF